MDDNNKNDLVISPEELKADEEIQKGVTDEELREKAIADFGLNPDENSDLIDKIVADRKAAHENLTKVIGQKVKYRNQLTTKPAEKKEDGSLKSEDVDKILDQRMAERDLKALGLPDDITAEINDLAKLKNISVGEASKLPYIQAKIAEVKKDERILGGTPVRINIGTAKSITIDPSKPLNPSDFDLTTEEGRKAWSDAKAEKEKYRNSH